MQRKGVAGGGGGPSPAQVAVYEHSFYVRGAEAKEAEAKEAGAPGGGAAATPDGTAIPEFIYSDCFKNHDFLTKRRYPKNSD